MSNARLKEQIEAAKIAFVHSAEAGSDANTPPTSGTVKQIPSISNDHAQHCVDSATETSRSPVNAETPINGQDKIVQSDFEKLEARLRGFGGPDQKPTTRPAHIIAKIARHHR